MLITNPGALAFLLIIPAIVLLYMVRSRYRQHRVSSVMLWRSVRRDLEARQKLRLPPLSLLMLLQILAILAGTAALVKPALSANDRTHLVIVMDTSVAMAATDVAPSRFEVARQRAREAIAQLQPGDQVSLIQAGVSPVLLVSGNDSATVLGALERLRPSSTTSDVVSALRVGESLINKTGGNGGILLLSDGAFGPDFSPPPVSVPVHFDPIGTTGDNQGITALDVRPDLDGSGRWTAFARVNNYSGHDVQVPAVATADGLPLDSRDLKIAPHGSTDLTFALPAGVKSFALSLSTGDVFPADDRADVRIDPPQQRKVLLVSKDPGPVEKLLKGMPGLQVSTVSPDSYKSSQAADLVVMDQFVPPTLPGADMLIMNPPLSAAGFDTSPARADASVLRSNGDSGLLDSVDLQSLRFGQSLQLAVPSWAHAVVEGQAGPLILQGDLAGRKIVVLNFDWQLTDLPRMQAFPLLLSNVVGELNPMALPSGLQPGEPVVLRPLADATGVTVKKPDGSTSDFSLSSGSYAFTDTDQVGQYVVTWKGTQVGQASSSFNVNLTSPLASDIAPGQYSFGSGSILRGPSPSGPGQMLWPFAAMALLMVMAAEWTYFTRRA